MAELKVLETRDNVLLKRKEVRYRVLFGREPTPKRDEVRQLLARNLGVDSSLVIVDRNLQEAGQHAITGYAKVYRDRESAMLYEPDYELIRNGLKQKEAS
ncbi:30S ribosomal protein S24e [Thermogymnomonas acidicola]|uniref:Small ribosomal subunit protein eS24 n=1 Tax=Thermogymnomonas acidicola TaxID=399579 RepID=A0AA37BRR5_9ARCH|nr:30S ribosomal protein S24e [Thermogymnomonas acidicola]GGM75568.1 30S ribosomal protein S24e [Thermogymnomonas acidicola]